MPPVLTPYLFDIRSQYHFSGNANLPIVQELRCTIYQLHRILVTLPRTGIVKSLVKKRHGIDIVRLYASEAEQSHTTVAGEKDFVCLIPTQ